MFVSTFEATPEKFKYSDRNNNSLEKKEFMIPWRQIEEIMRRKLVNVFQGIDILTHSKKTYTFNLLSEENCREFFAFVQKHVNESIAIIEDPRKYFQGSQQEH